MIRTPTRRRRPLALAALVAAAILLAHGAGGWGLESSAGNPVTWSGGMTRLAVSNSEAASYAVAAPGRVAALPAACPVYWLGPQSAEGQGWRHRGAARVTFFGEGADNATYSVRVYGVSAGYRRGTARVLDYDLALIYTVDVTLSTALSVSDATSGNDASAANDRLADTLALTEHTAATTPKGVAAVLRAAYAAPAPMVYSPADNTPAFLVLPDLYDFDGLLFDFDMTSSASGNALLKPGT